MNIRIRNTILGMSALALGIAVLVPPVGAQLDKVLEGAGIVVIVDRFGGEINRAVNKLTGDPGRVAGNKTKIVPILSVGQGAYAGAAQVSGPARAVDSVKAVAQIEGNVKVGVSLRMKGLIPVSNRNVKNSIGLERVYGVGITGLVDTKL